MAKHAANMAEMPAAAAERYLTQQIRVQRETMERRGISGERIRQEMRALELAIRATLWRIVMVGGRA